MLAKPRQPGRKAAPDTARKQLLLGFPEQTSRAYIYHVLQDAPGEGNGNPLQDSCLENPTDRGAWWATVHGVTKSRTRLNDSHTHQDATHQENQALENRRGFKGTRWTGVQKAGVRGATSHGRGQDRQAGVGSVCLMPRKREPVGGTSRKGGGRFVRMAGPPLSPEGPGRSVK